MKFLIDECLSLKLAGLARDRGFTESAHVNQLGLRSAPDEVIVRQAVTDGYVIVTNNARDFLRLVKQENTHPGLVCISAPGRINLDVQSRLFLYALDRLGDKKPTNEVIQTVLNPAQKVSFKRYAWPKLARQ